MELHEIFREFVAVVKEKSLFDIGLLSSSGIVIDCSDETKIGTKQQILETSKTDAYHEIFVSKKHAGFLWVHGEDESLRLVSSLLADSLDTRISAEQNDELLRRNMTKDDELVKCLLDEKEFQTEKVLRLVDELGIDTSMSRVAIYVRFERNVRFDDVLFSLKMQSTSDDLIVSTLDSKTILFFKAVPKGVFGTDFDIYIREYIASLIRLGVKDCRFTVGSLQSKLKNYAVSYKHSKWLYVEKRPKKNGVSIFGDSVADYFTSLFAIEEVSLVYDYYEEQSRGVDKAELIEIADTLLSTDFNLSKTAEKMFLHKNTLIYKIHKYEKIFKIDIRGSFQGKYIFALIAKMYRDEKRKRQVGIES